MRDGYTTKDAALPVPNMAVLRLNRRGAPEVPLDPLGTFWGNWITGASNGAGAPADYVLVALLSAASATIGNARHVRAGPDWTEPPVLWCAAVGDPSSGKSPAADPVMRMLAALEEEQAQPFADVRRTYETAKEGAAARKAKWLGEVKEAAKLGNPPPMMPADAVAPIEPQRPRIRANDATQEKLAAMLAGLPKGLLYTRDELAGWIGNFDRYSGGGDRQFWIETYGGRSYTADRVKHPEPVRIPHLSVAIFGGIQPDRLSAIMRDADDGLLPRFLWAWPEKAEFRRPTQGADHATGLAASRRLAGLEMGTDENGALVPVPVPLSAAAVELLHTVREDLHGREAGGLMAGAIGKAPGHIIRLALVLEFLCWSASATVPEPREISIDALRDAAALVVGYFLPMADRVFGDAAVSLPERHASALAKWIVRTRPDKINERALRETDRPLGLPRDSSAIKAACTELEEAAWLIAATASSVAGRPRRDYLVNPAIWDALPGSVTLLPDIGDFGDFGGR
jgi:hypothetical protein